MPTVEPFGAKCIFRHRDLGDTPGAFVYEERVVVLLAESQEDAVRKAEAEAKHYASELQNVEYLGFVVVYDMSESQVVDGTEVFSLRRQTDLEPDDFISRYYDDGTERSQEFED